MQITNKEFKLHQQRAFEAGKQAQLTDDIKEYEKQKQAIIRSYQTRLKDVCEAHTKEITRQARTLLQNYKTEYADSINDKNTIIKKQKNLILRLKEENKQLKNCLDIVTDLKDKVFLTIDRLDKFSHTLQYSSSEIYQSLNHMKDELEAKIRAFKQEEEKYNEIRYGSRSIDMDKPELTLVRGQEA